MKTIVTTSWDDGYKADKRVAELLNKHGIKGTFYVCLNRPNERRLTDVEIRKIAKTQEIGSHTMTHPKLTKIPMKDAEREIVESKKKLETILGKKVVSFSYPFGSYNETTKELVKRAGYIQARADKKFHFSNRDPFAINVTCDAYQHRLLGNCMLLAQSGREGIKFLLTEGFANDWVKLAKKTFDFVLCFGGVWHLLGHSCEIERRNSWKKLEDVFEYLSGRDIKYCFNKDLVKFIPK